MWDKIKELFASPATSAQWTLLNKLHTNMGW